MLLVAFMTVVFFAIAALVVDLGQARVMRREAQAASDASSLAGMNALYLAGTPTADMPGAIDAAKRFAAGELRRRRGRLGRVHRPGPAEPRPGPGRVVHLLQRPRPAHADARARAGEDDRPQLRGPARGPRHRGLRRRAGQGADRRRGRLRPVRDRAQLPRLPERRRLHLRRRRLRQRRRQHPEQRPGLHRRRHLRRGQRDRPAGRLHAGPADRAGADPRTRWRTTRCPPRPSGDWCPRPTRAAPGARTARASTARSTSPTAPARCSRAST